MDRTDIYYWKCDRAAAFHGTADYEKDQTAFTVALGRALGERFGAALADLKSGPGQGNHRTFTAKLDGADVLFVGPADLGFDLKARGSSLTLDDCLPKVAAAAKASGKHAGILTRDDADVSRRLALGYTHQAVDSDLGILRRRWAELTGGK